MNSSKSLEETLLGQFCFVPLPLVFFLQSIHEVVGRYAPYGESTFSFTPTSVRHCKLNITMFLDLCTFFLVIQDVLNTFLEECMLHRLYLGFSLSKGRCWDGTWDLSIPRLALYH